MTPDPLESLRSTHHSLIQSFGKHRQKQPELLLDTDGVLVVNDPMNPPRPWIVMGSLTKMNVDVIGGSFVEKSSGSGDPIDLDYNRLIQLTQTRTDWIQLTQSEVDQIQLTRNGTDWIQLTRRRTDQIQLTRMRTNRIQLTWIAADLVQPHPICCHTQNGGWEWGSTSSRFFIIQIRTNRFTATSIMIS